MPVSRKNCIVIDISILPRRPSIPDLKKFLEEELKANMTALKSLQLNNVKNVVYLVMHSEEAASSFASKHHMKHCMECDGIKLRIPIPIYVDSTAVDVRVNDLPEEIDNLAVINFMSQYGSVFSIRNDVWRNYFPGLNNGVRVVRMQISKPIPSYVTIQDETTSITYHQQVRTCKNCGKKAHPNFRCSEAVAQSGTPTNSISPPLEHQTETTTTQQQNETLNFDKQWPSLSKPAAAGGNPTAPKLNKNETKRQRSIDSDTSNNPTTKKPTTSVASDSSDIVFSDGSSARPRMRRVSYSWIEDAELRKQYIDEDDRRINELISQGCKCD